MNLHCRKLEESDRDKIIKLADSRDTLLKLPITTTQSEGFKETLNLYLDEKERFHYLFGIFNEDCLLCIWGLVLWDTLPYGTFTDFKIDKEISTPSIAKLCVKVGLESLLDWTYQRGVHTIYYLMAASYIGKEFLLEKDGQSLLSNFSPILERYHFDLEVYIPAKTEPYSLTYKRMTSFKTHDIDLCIRRMTLKDRYKLERQAKVLGLNSVHELFNK